ncbi:unnamed protein product [Callosobruchus maculatus]|uniref:Uncharacterized protein n=1 Tax=Callosobruchus maculatus TaxID=64391 RepID=A0A653DKI4_CALMS|nr:unnamed protein product [Callosobruchus maculatus]
MALFTGHLRKLTEWFSKYFADDDLEKFPLRQNSPNSIWCSFGKEAYLIDIAVPSEMNIQNTYAGRYLNTQILS